MIKAIKSTMTECVPFIGPLSAMQLVGICCCTQNRSPLMNAMGATVMILGSISLIGQIILLPTFREKKIYHPQNLAIATAITAFLASYNYAYFAGSRP